MSDSISRQVVLNTLDNMDKALDEDRRVEKYKELLTECINELPSAENKGEWIPVSERLPEEGTYLICTDNDYIATIIYDRSVGWLLSAKIIAWMPLPEPYKGVSE